MSALEIEMPQRLLDNAVAFHEAGWRCSAIAPASTPPFKQVALGAPTVVCFAFAIEQFLKLLLLLQTGKYPGEHRLDTLFDLLPPALQDQIEVQFGNASGARYYLERAKDAFVTWRYPHEKHLLIADDEELAEIGNVLRSIARALRPDLTSVFER